MGALRARTASDVLVIGGGPAGAAAAIRLARSGAQVTLIERDRTTQPKVCGEFLSVEACEEVRTLGIDPVDLGAAPIDCVRVTWRKTTVESKLPFQAASLSRAVFDEALLQAAERAGAKIYRATRALTLTPPILTARQDQDTITYEAPAIVLATGKSELPNQKRTADIPDALGFKMHLALPERDRASLGTAVELTLFPGGYYGMQHIENNQTAFALVITRRAFADYNSWPTLLAHLKQTTDCSARLQNATELWPKPLAVSGVPYGFMYREQTTADPATRNLYRVGDQLAVIPSFTGDGMAIALVTGSQAATAIINDHSAQTFHAAMRTRLQRPMLVAGALSKAITTPLGRAAVIWPATIIPQIFSTAASLTRINRN